MSVLGVLGKSKAAGILSEGHTVNWRIAMLMGGYCIVIGMNVAVKIWGKRSL